MQPTPCVREMPSSLAGSWWKFPAINVRVSAVKGCVLPESPLLWWFKAEESIANRQRGPLPAFFPSCSIEVLIEVPMFDRSSIQFCLFVYLLLFFLGSSRSIDHSKVFLIRHVFENVPGTSPEQPRSFILQQANLAKSRDSQFWESMDVNGCQWMSMDVNGISGAETDLFDFYLPVHWGDLPSCSP